MDFKQELADIFKQYPFIYFDTSGEITILIPLTGAQTISEFFTDDKGQKIYLYLFGDNTCQSDIERKKFFEIFDDEFGILINDLKQLNKNLKQTDADFLQLLISNLRKLKNKADQFKVKGSNPGYQEMALDLEQKDNLFATKGEFIVKGAFDTHRALDLPNILNFTADFKKSNQGKIISRGIDDYCLESISKIKPISHDSLNDLIGFSINKLENQFKLYLEKIKNKNIKTEDTIALFQALYIQMQDIQPSINNVDANSLATIANSFSECFLPYLNGSEKVNELKYDIVGLFKNSKVFENMEPPTSFYSIYNHVFNMFKIEYPNAYEQKIQSYMLFILQTFLFLCSIQLRLKNITSVKRFLKFINNQPSLHHLITQLTTDETAFQLSLQEKFNIFPTEYQKITQALYEITIPHIDSGHFDELRIMCAASKLENVHYVVMAGKLCWSTVPIDIIDNINTLTKQQQISDENFVSFYKNHSVYLEKENVLRKILANSEEKDNIFPLLKHHVLFSVNDKNNLLIHSIKSNHSQCVEYLFANNQNARVIFVRSIILMILKEEFDTNHKLFNIHDVMLILKCLQPKEITQIFCFCRRQIIKAIRMGTGFSQLFWLCSALNSIEVVSTLIKEIGTDLFKIIDDPKSLGYILNMVNDSTMQLILNSSLPLKLFNNQKDFETFFSLLSEEKKSASIYYFINIETMMPQWSEEVKEDFANVIGYDKIKYLLKNNASFYPMLHCLSKSRKKFLVNHIFEDTELIQYIENIDNLLLILNCLEGSKQINFIGKINLPKLVSFVTNKDEFAKIFEILPKETRTPFLQSIGEEKIVGYINRKGLDGNTILHSMCEKKNALDLLHSILLFLPWPKRFDAVTQLSGNYSVLNKFSQYYPEEFKNILDLFPQAALHTLITKSFLITSYWPPFTYNTKVLNAIVQAFPQRDRLEFIIYMATKLGKFTNLEGRLWYTELKLLSIPKLDAQYCANVLPEGNVEQLELQNAIETFEQEVVELYLKILKDERGNFTKLIAQGKLLKEKLHTLLCNQESAMTVFMQCESNNFLNLLKYNIDLAPLFLQAEDKQVLFMNKLFELTSDIDSFTTILKILPADKHEAFTNKLIVKKLVDFADNSDSFEKILKSLKLLYKPAQQKFLQAIGLEKIKDYIEIRDKHGETMLYRACESEYNLDLLYTIVSFLPVKEARIAMAQLNGSLLFARSILATLSKYPHELEHILNLFPENTRFDLIKTSLIDSDWWLIITTKALEVALKVLPQNERMKFIIYVAGKVEFAPVKYYYDKCREFMLDAQHCVSMLSNKNPIKSELKVAMDNFEQEELAFYVKILKNKSITLEYRLEIDLKKKLLKKKFKILLASKENSEQSIINFSFFGKQEKGPIDYNKSQVSCCTIY